MIKIWFFSSNKAEKPQVPRSVVQITISRRDFETLIVSTLPEFSAIGKDATRYTD